MQEMHLYFDGQFKAYALQVIPEHDDNIHRSYRLVIVRDHDVKPYPYKFRRIVTLDGECFEFVSAAQLRQLCEDVREHEGDQIADLWEANQHRYMVMRKPEEMLFDDHERRFLAFAEMGLSLPPVWGDTIDAELEPVLKPDMIALMDAITERQRAEDAANEFAAEIDEARHATIAKIEARRAEAETSEWPFDRCECGDVIGHIEPCFPKFQATRQPASLEEAAKLMAHTLDDDANWQENLEWMKRCDADNAYLYGTHFILVGPKGYQWMECGKSGPVREATLADAERKLFEEIH